MCRVNGTANGIRYKDDAEAAINGAEYGGENANVCLPARYHQRIYARSTQQRVELSFPSKVNKRACRELAPAEQSEPAPASIRQGSRRCLLG